MTTTMMTEDARRCDKCFFGVMAGKDYFGAGSVICRRYPQEMRKDGDASCGEFRVRMEAEKKGKK